MPIIYILVGGCQNPGRTVDEKKSVHFYEGNPIDSLTFKFLSFLPVFWQGPTYLESFGDSKTVLSWKNLADVSRTTQALDVLDV